VPLKKFFGIEKNKIDQQQEDRFKWDWKLDDDSPLKSQNKVHLMKTVAIWGWEAVFVKFHLICKFKTFWRQSRCQYSIVLTSPLIARALPEIEFSATNQKSYEALCQLIIWMKAINYVKKSAFVDEMTELICLSSCVDRQATAQFVEATSLRARIKQCCLQSRS